MTGCGYNASAQAGWTTFGKSFNLSALVQGYRSYGLPGVYRIDCVGCSEYEKGNPATGIPKNPGFAAGVICDSHFYDPNCTTCPPVYHMCSKSKGDATNWDEQTLHLLSLARPHLVSGALMGVFLGDELTASGHGSHPAVKGAVTFHDLEAWIDLVRGFLDALAPARRAAGVKEDLILYYMSSDYSRSWPYIPRNLTLFSLDDYSPAWRYPSCPSPCPSPCYCPCKTGGFPRPKGCENETAGLWVYPQYNAAIFKPGRLGPNTKLLVVPPTYGSHRKCSPPSVWCTNQSYAEWLELSRGNFTFYRDWAFSDERIIGFDPFPLYGCVTEKCHATTSMGVGLMQMPEILHECAPCI
jgi:hypothetical protein